MNKTPMRTPPSYVGIIALACGFLAWAIYYVLFFAPTPIAILMAWAVACEGAAWASDLAYRKVGALIHGPNWLE